MAGRLCTIISRERQFEASLAELTQFQLSDGVLVDASFVATDRNWTLYCLERETRQAVFVDMPDGFDLGGVPFAYMAQFDHATRALLVPFDELTDIAKQAAFVENPVFVFSIGRCGSTLVSKIFAQIPNVWSISEPDPLTNLALDRHNYSIDESAELLWAATRLSFRPPEGRDYDRFVIKLRSLSLFHTEPFVRAFPEAQNIFLHRDYDGWTKSVYRFGQKLGVHLESGPFEDIRLLWDIMSAGSSTDYLAPFCDINAPVVGIENILAATWAVNMEQYNESRAGGGQFHAFGYDQLNNDRKKTVARLLAACDLDQSYATGAMQAYEEDSQKGTAATSGRPTIPLSDVQRARIRDLLQKYPAVDISGTTFTDSAMQAD